MSQLSVEQLVVACSASTAALSIVAAVLSDRLRCRAFSLERRLLSQHERDMRAAVRAFMCASRESPHAVIRALDDVIRWSTPAIDAFLFFIHGNAALECIYATGIRAEMFLGHNINLDDVYSPLTRAAIAGHRISPEATLRATIPGDRAFLAVPLTVRAKTIAVVYMSSIGVDEFATEETIVTLTDLILPAYQLATDHAIARDRATNDALTGLLTPQAFRSVLAARLTRAQGQPAPKLALLFIDTDNFKLCNDTLGHAAGDVLLRKIAAILTVGAGVDAIVARNGGDEFCVILENRLKSQAIDQAEGIRKRVATQVAEMYTQEMLAKPITVSVGIATFPEDASSWSALLELADAAMYFSKRRGRNQLSFYDVDGSLANLGNNGSSA